MTSPNQATTPKQLFDQGEIAHAIERLIAEVRQNPTDAARRTFLFELLCFAGEWTRAERQLDAIPSGSANAELARQVYKSNLRAMQDRVKLHAEGLAPHFLNEPPAYVDKLLTALNRLREGNDTEAQTLLDEVEDERPAIPGTTGEQTFDDFRDYDDLCAPVLEAFVKDKYTWLPLEHLKSLEIARPATLRDLIWTQARIETHTGTMAEVYIPALYAGSEGHENAQVKLGRMTDWAQRGTVQIAQGLRVFLVGGEEKTLFELGKLQFSNDAVTDSSADESAADESASTATMVSDIESDLTS